MSDVQTLKQYLVGLGFSVNNTEFAKFANSLRDAAKTVKAQTAEIAADVIKWQGAIVGMFATVTGTVVAAIDKVGMADQAYRLFGERMFMDTKHARSLKIALDALNQPLEAIAFDPELHKRFMQLQLDQKNMSAGLGGDYESTMMQIRDIRFEFTRLKVEAEYFLMGVAKELFKQLGLGSGDLLKKLQQLNDWIIKNLPTWSRMFASYLVPILKDAWMIFKDLLQVAADFATLFDNIIGLLTGDASLMGAANFDKFARAIDDVVHSLAVMFHWLSKVQGMIAGAVIGSMFGPEGIAIGAGAGLAFDIGRGVYHAVHPGSALDAFEGSKSTDASIPAGLPNAVAQIESGNRQFDRSGNIITSNKGALGIMQLMPNTAKGLGVNPYDAAQNMAGGISLLRQLYKHYNGNLDNTLAAYNWGQGNVDKALRAGTPFPSSVQQYISAVEGRYMRSQSTSGGGSVTVTVGDINIMQPGASADEIQQKVVAAISDKTDKLNQRTFAALNPVFA